MTETWFVRKDIIEKVGAEAAVVYAFLLERREICKATGQLNEHGGFHVSLGEFYEELRFEAPKRDKANKKLISIGLIAVKREGHHGQNNFYIL